MVLHVYVKSIVHDHGQIVVTATNGSSEGPPAVKFVLMPHEAKTCHIGKAYRLTIEELTPSPSLSLDSQNRCVTPGCETLISKSELHCNLHKSDTER